MNESPRKLDPRYIALGGVCGLILFVIVAISLVIVFRDPLPPLTQETFDAAVERWETRGPASYDLDLVLEGDTPGVVHLEVRNGKVTSMTRDGAAPRERRTWDVWSVEGQFEMIGRELEMAEDPAREMRVSADTQLLLGAQFDPMLGYPHRFRRIVLGGGPQVSWRVVGFREVR